MIPIYSSLEYPQANNKSVCIIYVMANLDHPRTGFWVIGDKSIAIYCETFEGAWETADGEQARIDRRNAQASVTDVTPPAATDP